MTDSLVNKDTVPSATSREVVFVYCDPLDLIWVQAAARMGIEVRRDSEVFAAWDGAGVLRIGTPETLDADDSLAQMILHEMCHAIVEGPAAFSRLDWGLNMFSRKDRSREHACLRLQAALTGRFGLRRMLASTTDFRSFYNSLPDDPLGFDKTSNDPSIEIACAAMQAATTGRWSKVLDEALRRTAGIAAILKPVAPRGSLWSLFETHGE